MMRRLLVVSPQFAPVNAPDMQRARMSLPHFRAFGWDPIVLAVDPDRQEGPRDPVLLQSIPPDVQVVYASAIPSTLTRPFGVGNVAIRGFAHLYRAGARLIREAAIDLVYFSTTMFAAMALGRLWKGRFGVPYVLDFQDPWVSDYLDTHRDARPPKYRWARHLHRRLEPFTLRRTDGIIAVSPAYVDVLCRRYPRIAGELSAAIPFGFAAADYDVAAGVAWRNPWFEPGSAGPHGVYLGRGGADMAPAARILFRALARAGAPTGGAPRIWCIGTDYATDHRARETLRPVAVSEGLGERVHEEPTRLPYFAGLRLLREAGFVIVLGSADGGYNPSKVYTALGSGRPVLSILHADSPAASLLELADRGPVVRFRGDDDVEAPGDRLRACLPRFLASLDGPLRPPAEALAPYEARELTRQQCALFDAVLRRRALQAGAPCPE